MIKLIGFEIYGMNGDTNITVDFHDNKKVLIAENGSGKTTIMNIMYYALKNDIGGLKKYTFDKCILKFKDQKPIVFEKSKLEDEKLVKDLDQLDKNLSVSARGNISRNMRIFDKMGTFFFKRFGISSFESFIYEYFSYIILHAYKSTNHVSKNKELEIRDNKRKFIYNYLDMNELQNTSFFHEYIDDLVGLQKIDLILIYSIFEREFLFKKESFSYRDANSVINELLYKVLGHILIDSNSYVSDKKFLGNLDGKLIFLPTYRRIEHDFIELLSGEYTLKEGSVLSFGMGDVQNLFNKISEKIAINIDKKFNEIKDNALNDFIHSKNDLTSNKNYFVEFNISPGYFSKVLEKVAKNINSENKETLRQICRKGSHDQYLSNLIYKMCDIYMQQERVEADIKKYIEVCNKYLFKKTLIYNESTFKIEVIKQFCENEKGGSIRLTNLSSGEKQIISLFAKLYLLHLLDLDLNTATNTQKKKGYWILFDEPELSLSVEWQEMLLPDILASDRCEFLFATTHSPFIFNNDLRFYTSHIMECVKEAGK